MEMFLQCSLRSRERFLSNQNQSSVIFFVLVTTVMTSSVLESIESLPSLPELRVKSVRSAAVLNAAERVKACCRQEANRDRFATFCCALDRILGSVLSEGGEGGSLERAKMWTAFHQVREFCLVGVGKNYPV